jgi:gliding motility-associated lipoprotein GldD
MINLIKSLFAVLILMLLSGCQENYTPKPRGFLRIDLPEKEYKSYDSLINYTFEYPLYATVVTEIFTAAEMDWLNIEFPRFKGSLHLSYKSVDNNLSDYVEDSRNMLMQHLPKASGINDSLIINSNRKVYGMIYQIAGKGAASPVQFYLTDSSNHFIRGALYFNIRPNNDSLSPVIEFLKQDIRHFINSLEWK